MLPNAQEAAANHGAMKLHCTCLPQPSGSVLALACSTGCLISCITNRFRPSVQTCQSFCPHQQQLHELSELLGLQRQGCGV